MIYIPKRGEAFYFRPLTEAPRERISVMSLGIRETMPPGFIRHGGPNGDAVYLFMDFHSPAQLNTSEGAEPFDKGFILWRPGATHYYGNPTGPWLHSWLNATGTVIDEAVAEYGLELDRLWSLDLSAISSKYLQAIYDELQDHVVPDDHIVETLISLWIREIARALGSDRTPPPERLVEVRRHIEGHFTETLKLEDLARRAALSASHFSGQFKRYFGVSPVEYGQRLRLRRAAQLLDDPSLSVADVAARVGYDDPLYFSRQFKKHMGKDPRSFRRWRAGGPKRG